jgi:ER-bound oxygenase mpaB/B'/Rubber oxygenase, catalytic domain
MTDFVNRDSIVREIWGDSDMILLIFAGSAAEFALNRAVDWLFYTNQVPSDPIGRLFSTARYAQEIVFVDEVEAQRTLDRINAAHVSVQRRRGEPIPDWAFRDVLYMLIDHSERAYRLLFRPLTHSEQEELYSVFHRIGERLNIQELPANYDEWQTDRLRHLERDLAYTPHTGLLYERYREHLGEWRYQILLQVQALLVPERVRHLLGIEPFRPLALAARAYGFLRVRELRSLIHWLLLPSDHLDEVKQLEHPIPVSVARP